MSKRVLLGIAGLLLSLPGLGKLPVPSAAPIYAKGPGSYQLADNSWHRAPRMEFDGTTLSIKNEAKKTTLELASKELKQFEIERDTFLLMRELPGQAGPDAEPAWVESLFYQRGVRLLQQFDASADIRWFLALPQEPLQELSTQRSEFKETMLELTKNCPTLARKIARDSLGRDRVLELLEEYVECQAAPAQAKQPEEEPTTEPPAEPGTE